MAASSTRYALEGELRGTVDTDSHTAVVALVGSDKRVLEAGCANGFTSRHLSRNGCSVVGLEVDPILAKEAEEVCERVVVADLDSVDLTEAVEDERFDVIIFADVLEHLKRPLEVLRQARTMLKPDGFVVASIPNIAHASVRLALLQGRFEYRPLGLLDNTHVRFFTRATIEELFQAAALEITQTHRIVADTFATEIPVNPADFPPEVIQIVHADPESRTYQFVVKAVIGEGNEAVRELHQREERQRRELDDARADIARLAAEAQQLRMELQLQRSAFDADSKRRDDEAGAERAALQKTVDDARAVATAFQQETERMRITATFRYTRMARRIYGKLRGSTPVAGPGDIYHPT